MPHPKKDINHVKVLYSSAFEFHCEYKALDKGLHKGLDTTLQNDLDNQEHKDLIAYKIDVVSDPWKVFSNNIKKKSFNTSNNNNEHSINNDKSRENDTSTVVGITSIKLLEEFLKNQTLDNFSALNLRDRYARESIFHIINYFLVEKTHLELLQQQKINENKFLDDYCLSLEDNFDLLGNNQFELIHFPNKEYYVFFNSTHECVYFSPRLYILSGDVWKKQSMEKQLIEKQSIEDDEAYLLSSCPNFTEKKTEICFLDNLCSLYENNVFPKVDIHSYSIINFALAHSDKPEYKKYKTSLPTTSFGEKTDTYFYPLHFFADGNYYEAWTKSIDIASELLHRDITFEETIQHSNLMLGIANSYLVKKYQIDQLLHINFKEMVKTEVDESYADIVYTQINYYFLDNQLKNNLSSHKRKNKI